MTLSTSRALVVGPGEGRLVDLGGLGVHFKVSGRDTAGAVAVVEHPIAPRLLVPPHVHTKEDELSYVLSGRIGARIGDEIVEASEGSYIFKPRNVGHTFWNPTDEPARLLEIIVPAGFDQYFAEIADLFATGVRPGGPEHEAISHRYGESHFFDWVPELKARYGLRLLGEQ